MLRSENSSTLDLVLKSVARLRQPRKLDILEQFRVVTCDHSSLVIRVSKGFEHLSQFRPRNLSLGCHFIEIIAKVTTSNREILPNSPMQRAGVYSTVYAKF